MYTSSERNRHFFYAALVLLCLNIFVLNQWIRSEHSSAVLCPATAPNFGVIPSTQHSISERMELDDLNEKPQDDPFLIRYLRQFHVYPPSKGEYRYSTLDKSRRYFVNESRHVTSIIQSYLKNMTGGIFVEAGANNGADELSNTLVLERDYNWSGLLVEGSPLIFPKLMAAHRKSWTSDLLLSKYSNTKLVVFNQGPNFYAGKAATLQSGKEAAVDVVAKDGKTPLFNYELLTVPLYSLIAACNFQTIDFLSLDVEGTELEILMNFPFDKVLIRTMIVEVNVLKEDKTRQLTEFLIGKGYIMHHIAPTPRDLIFVHQSVISGDADS